ncbi:hypothetical protein L210DRAFT_3654720 [Boletus edulis BED1]|uniref:Uncharacterized protein n=1 Tax=Boletus edulis BED1 TaxID=1328754 RepID=A0AAD4BD55_BOLED|nr:hypothetical protein L210DRAFT_3654720 [Boletus edulis BED1]
MVMGMYPQPISTLRAWVQAGVSEGQTPTHTPVYPYPRPTMDAKKIPLSDEHAPMSKDAGVHSPGGDAMTPSVHCEPAIKATPSSSSHNVPL